jgi:acyl-CoA reductase-like NAD-dependent aldehyde dehydrogenase
MGNEVPERDLYIGGNWVKPVKGERFDVICPHDERKIGSIPLATAQDVDAAVTAAQAAKGAWGRSTGASRAEFLRKIAEKVTRAAECSSIYHARACVTQCGMQLG